MLIELDIHFRIEDDLNYPALKEAGTLIAIAHADEEERDLIPAPPEVRLTDAELEELGDKMFTMMERYRGSALHRLHQGARGAGARLIGTGGTTRLRRQRGDRE